MNPEHEEDGEDEELPPAATLDDATLRYWDVTW
jgi:hypothetical protein